MAEAEWSADCHASYMYAWLLAMYPENVVYWRPALTAPIRNVLEYVSPLSTKSLSLYQCMVIAKAARESATESKIEAGDNKSCAIFSICGTGSLRLSEDDDGAAVIVDATAIAMSSIYPVRPQQQNTRQLVLLSDMCPAIQKRIIHNMNVRGRKCGCMEYCGGVKES